MSLLITGGLGYIGSHISKIYQEDEIIIIDNLSNSQLNYKKALPKAKVIIDDINLKSLNHIFKNYDIRGVIHLAGLKSVDESIKYPLNYYRRNVTTTLDLLENMEKFKVNKLIFSSSATVYGNENLSPLEESFDTSAINPYGETKIINENLIKNYCKSNKDFSSIILRYFNPIGAHMSGDLADNPAGKPQNIMPLIIEAAKKDLILKVFGNDYSTKDGTCVRDYIHVIDLAESHLLSLKYLNTYTGYEILNVGLGKGISVLELINLFEKTNKIKIRYEFSDRRAGDTSISFASNVKIKKILNWSPLYSYETMCRDSWNASKNNTKVL